MGLYWDEKSLFQTDILLNKQYQTVLEMMPIEYLDDRMWQSAQPVKIPLSSEHLRTRCFGL